MKTDLSKAGLDHQISLIFLRFGTEAVRLLTLFDYVYEAELDHQISSIPRLLKYMTESQICRKLQVT